MGAAGTARTLSWSITGKTSCQLLGHLLLLAANPPLTLQCHAFVKVAFFPPHKNFRYNSSNVWA